MGEILEIRALGGLTILHDGTAITGFDSRKVPALLVYLACTRRDHPREVLAELFWEDRTQAQALSNLRVALTSLRQTVEPFVTITRESVGLNPDATVWLDAAEFETLLSAAGTDAAQLTSALDLYRGDFLAGFFVDSAAFEAWTTRERERLRLRAMAGLDALLAAHLEDGAYPAGIAAATRLLDMDPLREETHRQLMDLLARSGQRGKALEQYETCRRLLDDELGVAPAPETTVLYERIRAGEPLAAPVPQAAEPAPEPEEPAPPVTNPYKGLRAFQEADAPDFFGREALTDRLLDRLAEDVPFGRFLAVVGPSGCGKSSAVRAGLIPALRRGALPGSEGWPILQVLPGAHPFDELDIALARLAGDPSVRLLDELRRDTRGLLRAARRVLPEDAADLLLVIDQFEEVFTLVADPAEAKFLLDSLYAAVTEPRSPLRVVITLRADFYDRPLMYPDFSEMVRQRTEAVVPLTTGELERAICGPAGRVGLSLESGLATTIVSDVSEQPGALPLLQYALTELFDGRDDHTLTLATYRNIGGALGALARRADAVYGMLAPEAQAAARQVCLRLVTLGEGTEDIRRRALQDELLAAGGEATQTVLDAFDRARLVTFDQDPATGAATVELAHEAIIREWARLRAWLDASRDDVRQQRLLAAAAQEWQSAERDRSYLLTGSRLAQFEGWAGQTDLALTPDERAYLDASVTEHRRQRARRRRVRNAVVAVTAAVAVIMTVLAILALQARSAAQDERDNANAARLNAEREAAVNRSLVLANAAVKVSESDGPGYALPLALEAVNMERPPNEAVITLQTLALGAGTRAILRDEGNAIKAVAFSPNSRQGLSGGCATLENEVCSQGELILWDLVMRAEIRRFEGHTNWVNSVAFGPDGSTILSASDDQTLILWDVATGEIIRRLEGHTGAVKSMALSPDGQTAISGSADGTLRIWDVNNGETVHRLEGYAAIVKEVVLSPDGQVAASYTDDAIIILWDVATGQEIRRLDGHHTNAISALNFRPITTSEYRLFVSAVDNRFVEWDVDTGQIIREFAASNHAYHVPISGDGRTGLILLGIGPCLFDMEQFRLTQFLWERLGGSEAAAISPDGHSILIGHMNGVLRLCDMPASAEVRRFQAEVPLASVDVSPDGRSLLTGAIAGGVAILWDVQTGQEIRRFEGLEAMTWQVEFSPDGQLAALGTSSKNVGGVVVIVVVDIATGQEIHRLEGHEFGLRSLAFSPDGRYLLTGSMQYTPEYPVVGGGELFLWDVETGTMVRRFEETKAVMGIEFSPDGRQVVTGSDLAGGYLSLWDVSTGQLIRRFYDFSAIKNQPDEALWEPDGVHILVSGQGGIVEMNIQTGEVTRFFGPAPAAIMFLSQSPDWRYLVGMDIATPGNLIVWDFATGAEVRHFTPYNAPGWNVVFSPQGQTVFATSIGENWVGEWQVGDWPLDDLLAWVHENRYVREFTCEERAQYRIEPLCE